MRREVRALVALGPLPDSASGAADLVRVERYQELIEGIQPPVTDEEALALLALFGPDESFGLAWALVHLVESAPGWPIMSAIAEPENEWVALLRDRSSRGA